MNDFHKLKELVAQAESDAEKFYNNGNKAAGTRLRKTYLEIKNLCGEARKNVQELKNNSAE